MTIANERAELEERIAILTQDLRKLQGKLDALRERCPHNDVRERRAPVFPPWIKYCNDCGKDLGAA